jgi:hypothetical protein
MKTRFTVSLIVAWICILLLTPEYGMSQNQSLESQKKISPNSKKITKTNAPGDVFVQPSLNIFCPEPIFEYTDLSACGTTIFYNDPSYTGGALSFTGLPSGSFFPVGFHEIIFTVTSTTGTSKSCTLTIEIGETQPPIILSYPPDVNANTNPGSSFSTSIILTPPTISDDCSTPTLVNDAPAQFPIGTTTVTWTGSDISGNTVTCTNLVVVTDIEPPVVQAPADITVNTDPNLPTASLVNLGTPTAVDNDQISSITNNAPAVFPLGNTTLTWTVFDNSGNSTVVSQQVTVLDNEPPVLTIAAVDVTYNTAPGLNYALNAGLTPPTFTDNSGNYTITNNAGSTFPIGNTTIIWTATDAAGNVITSTQILTVNDLEPPVIISPANLSLPSDPGTCSTWNVSLGTPIVTDNNVVLSVTNDAPAEFLKGTTTVTWTATDASGNVATQTQTVTILDAELPIINAPEPITAATNPGQAFATGITLIPPVCSDNCSPSLVITNNAPAQFSIGITEITWTATDESGNISTLVQTVTISDLENPVLTCPTDISRGQCNNVVTFTPTATDNSQTSVSIVTTPASGSVFPVGINTVNVTATDFAGNSTSCTFNVTILPNPTATATYNTGLCAGGALALNAGGGTTYAWSGPGGFSSNIQNPTRANATVAMAGTYTVSVTNNSGCVATASVVVAISALPTTPTTIVGKASVLKGGSYSYTTTIANATGYVWTYSGTGATITGNNTNTISIKFSTTATNGVLSVKGTNSCGNGASTNLSVTTTASSCIHVYCSKHHVGSGCHPSTNKTHCSPVNEPGSKCGFKVYRSHEIGYSCKRNRYQKIYNKSCNGIPGNPSFNDDSDVTDDICVSGPTQVNCGGGSSYKYDILVPAGKRYCVIGKFEGTAYQNGTHEYIYPGKRTYNRNNHSGLSDDDDDGDDDGDDDNSFSANCSKDMYIDIIQDAYGKVRACNTDAVPGSMLLIKAPVTVEFTDSIELLPIVYESLDGIWDIGVTATPPEGFYSVEDTLQEFLNTSNLSTLQFTLVDTGSVWTETRVTTNLKHNNSTIKHSVSAAMIDNKATKDLLSQNYPNPFSETTKIPYTLPKECRVKLSIYDIYGRELLVLVDKIQKKGNYTESWNGSIKSSKLRTGTYLLHLQATSIESGKVMISDKTMIFVEN